MRRLTFELTDEPSLALRTSKLARPLLILALALSIVPSTLFLRRLLDRFRAIGPALQYTEVIATMQYEVRPSRLPLLSGPCEVGIKLAKGRLMSQELLGCRRRIPRRLYVHKASGRAEI